MVNWGTAAHLGVAQSSGFGILPCKIGAECVGLGVVRVTSGNLTLSPRVRVRVAHVIVRIYRSETQRDCLPVLSRRLRHTLDLREKTLAGENTTTVCINRRAACATETEYAHLNVVLFGWTCSGCDGSPPHPTVARGSSRP